MQDLEERNLYKAVYGKEELTIIADNLEEARSKAARCLTGLLGREITPTQAKVELYEEEGMDDYLNRVAPNRKKKVWKAPVYFKKEFSGE